ncbi:MAG: hypothetical protein ABL994_23905, partial [Verrucomicrobiales bacterium]
MQVPAEAADETDVEKHSAPRLNVPPPSGVTRNAPSAPQEFQSASSKPEFGSRGGWTETDPTNANIFMSLGIGAGATVLFLLFLLAFSPEKGTPSSEYTFMQYLSTVWTGHLAVN